MIPANNTIPYERRPLVTWTMMLSCTAVFCLGLTFSENELRQFFEAYALVPARLTSGADLNPLPFLTCMFLHGGLLHIASNLWVLWVFGPAVEDRMGPLRFATLYLASGLAAGAVHVLFNWTSPVPTIGASGAIAGVIAAYARRFPYAWVNIFQPIGIVPAFATMPALAFAGIWFTTQVAQGSSAMLAPGGGGGVAWWAHVGGFVAGWMLVKRLAPPTDMLEETRTAAASALWPLTEWSRWMLWFSKLWWRR